MNKVKITNILLKYKENNKLSKSELQFLKDQESNLIYYDKNFLNHPKILEQKLDILPNIYTQINSLCKSIKLVNESIIINNLWNFWLPLALELAEKAQENLHPLIIGILGGQGTGKTTLTKILSIIWQYLGLSCVAISLDDLYKTYEDRQKLIKIDSRLIWRGPPATHDVQLGIDILTQLYHRNYPVFIPRFDKSLYNGLGDRITSDIVNQGDIIIFEGWFVGVQQVSSKKFSNAPYPIITLEDQKFALDCHERLKEYLPLWAKLNYLMILKPEDYQYSLQWRKEAEKKMIMEGKTGMSDLEIEKFVYYFWKALHPEIYINPLTKNSNYTDLVINLSFDHSISEISHLKH